MPHPVVDNKTPFEAELLFAADEEGRPLVASLVKATFAIRADGQISLAEEQRPVNYAGSWWGAAGESSYQFEPEVAFSKPATDVVLHGVARPQLRGQTELDVDFRVGPVRQRAVVRGPRVWDSGLLGMKISAPSPLEEVPLIYENAFGGWDRSPADEAHHRAWEANSVGVGYYTSRGKPSEGDPLPSIECPRNGLRKVGGKARTVGFGFTQPHWQPRAKFAGTFDEVWDQTRRPLLPSDFDRRHWNAAAPELIADGFLRGDETVLVEGTVPEGRLRFDLPGIPAPVCRLSLQAGAPESLTGDLDTVIVDTERMELVLLWRSYVHLKGGPVDVLAAEILLRVDSHPSLRPASSLAPTRV